VLHETEKKRYLALLLLLLKKKILVKVPANSDRVWLCNKFCLARNDWKGDSWNFSARESFSL